MSDEDSVRRARILTILLYSVLTFSTFNCLWYIIFLLHRLFYLHLPILGGQPHYLITFEIAIITLIFLSKKGYQRLVSFILIFLCYFAALFTSIKWGVSLPQSLQLFTLVIVMSGVLINTRFAVTVFIISALTLLALTIMQISQLTRPDLYWTSLPLEITDAVVYIVMIGIITSVYWLLNREMELALRRAEASEADLKAERDLLEIKVETRTRELKQLQLEKMSQLYRFADFGRLTAGLIHDLVNPLTQISLELAQLKKHPAPLQLKQAIAGTKRMERFVAAVKKQIQGQETSQFFNLHTEINAVLLVFQYKAKKARVELVSSVPKALKLFGNPIRFHQLISNLLANAIDAYADLPLLHPRQVIINVSPIRPKHVQITVTDTGIGIKPHALTHIFEPFYTTKEIEAGTGIGLSIAQIIVEKHFHGTITAHSVFKHGSVLTVTLPL